MLNSCIGSEYYLGYFKNVRGTRASLVLLTTQLQPVAYFLEAPGVGDYHNGTLTADNAAIVYLNDNVVVSSHIEQDKAIYLTTDSNRVTVIGQTNSTFSSSDTFLALLITNFCAVEYTYYGISVERAISTASGLLFTSIVLVIGTENNTTMKLTVPQSVNVSVGNITNELTPDREYSFIINRLQTVFIESVEDLTGTKIITDNQVSVFSGHQGGSIPNTVSGVDYLIEQIPSIAFWGTKHYVAPLNTRQSYTTKILAAYSFTGVVIHCNNNVESFTIHEGGFIVKTLSDQDYCAIHSNKSTLVVQFTHGQQDDPGGDSMMAIVPATVQYLNRFDFSTIKSTRTYRHFVNIIVMAQYHQPNMIYLTTGGVNTTLESQSWMPIIVNNITEAYVAGITISEGVSNIVHLNPAALMTTIVYGFTDARGYGHPAGLNQNQIYSGRYCVYILVNCYKAQCGKMLNVDVIKFW